MTRSRRALVAATLIVATVMATLVTGAGQAGAAGAPDAVNQSVNYAAARSITQFISVVDRANGTVLAQTGNARTQVASESIMKLFLAGYYLILYGGYQSTPADVKDRLSFMLRYSDNDIASSLFTSSAIPTIAARYGMPNTSNATDRVGHWGAARITAADMTTFLFRASQDPAVGPWLMPVMAQTAPTGSADDAGFSQAFGLNALTGDHGSKQGWGCDSFWTSPTCAVHSVGYTDRGFVAILQLGNGYPDPMRETSTNGAQLIQRALKPDPIGALDSVTSTGMNTLTVQGWAADPAAPGHQEEVHVYVWGANGRAGPWGLRTGVSRGDVAGVFPWAGSRAGFSNIVPTQGAGTNMVCAYAINVSPPQTNPQIGCRWVEVRNPFGYYDSVAARPGVLDVKGWAVNPNNRAERVEIWVYDIGPAGTREYRGFRAGNSRPDVAAAFPDYDAQHGFTATIPSLMPGKHDVCAWAITTGGGSGNVGLGCRTIQVRNTFGNYDAVTVKAGRIVATGWAANPNDKAEQVEIWVYDTSRSGTRLYKGIRAGAARPDVAAAFPGYGQNHGFATDLPTVEPGRHDVCVWAIGTKGGTGNPWFGCRTVTVAG